MALDNYELSEQLTCLLRQPYRAFSIEIFPEGSRPSGSFHWNCALSKTIMDRAAVLISRYSRTLMTLFLACLWVAQYDPYKHVTVILNSAL